MINGLYSELYKLLHARIFWVLLAMSAVLSIFITGLLFLEEKGLLMEQITVEVEEENRLEGFYMLIESVVEPDTFFVYLFAALLASFFISSEYTNGTIKNVVSTGYKRYTIYTAKFLVVWLGTIVVFVSMVVTFSIFATLFFELGDFPSKAEWLMAAKAFGYTCLLIGAFSAISTFISIHARSSAIALVATLGFYLIFSTGVGMLAQQYTFFADILHYSVFDYMHRLAIALQGDRTFIWALIRTTLITTCLFYVGGIALFKRKDIQ